MVAALHLCLVFGFIEVPNQPLEPGMRNVVWKHHNHTYKFYIKYFLQFKNYKHGDGEEL
jgi:hypothetical protein